MATQMCSNCSATIPAEARFCPRCGRERAAEVKASAAAEKRARGGYVHPAKAPIPTAGMVFIAAAVLGPAFIVFGLVGGGAVALFAGIAISLVTVVLLLVGMVFS